MSGHQVKTITSSKNMLFIYGIYVKYISVSSVSAMLIESTAVNLRGASDGSEAKYTTVII